MSVGPSEPQFLVSDRQLRALHNVYALGEGWPFGDGPMQWYCHVETRPDCWMQCDDDCGFHCWNWHRGRSEHDWHDPATCKGQIHAVCDQCSQSVLCLVPDLGERGFTWNLELLKSRIADHVLKVHPEAAT